MTSFAHPVGWALGDTLHFQLCGSQVHLFPVFTGEMSNGLGHGQVLILTKCFHASWVNVSLSPTLGLKPLPSLPLGPRGMMQGDVMKRNWTLENDQGMKCTCTSPWSSFSLYSVRWMQWYHLDLVGWLFVITTGIKTLWCERRGI